MADLARLGTADFKKRRGIDRRGTRRRLRRKWKDAILPALECEVSVKRGDPAAVKEDDEDKNNVEKQKCLKGVFFR